MSVTIKDIAKIADVSYSTVSKALNNSPLVKAATKEKINNIADELGYQPNSAAQKLVSNKTFSIGLIWPTIERVVLSTLVSEINNQIEDTPYSMVLSVEPIQKSLKTFERFQVDGIIYFDESFNEPIPETTIPLAIYGVNKLEQKNPTINPDHATAIFKAVQYLKSLGHQNIAYIGDYNQNDPRQINKVNGYLEALKALELPLLKENIINTYGLNWYNGYTATKQIFQHHHKPTAILGGSYDISGGIIRSIKDEGFSIPEDFSLISYDNIPQMERMEIPLTCVGAPLVDIAKNIVEVILQQINKSNNTDSNLIVKLDPKITERQSCKNITVENSNIKYSN